MYIIEVHNRMKQIIDLFYRLGVWENEELVVRKLAKKYFLSVFYLSFWVSVVTGLCLSNDIDESILLAVVTTAVAVFVVKLKFILFEQKAIYGCIENICTHSLKDEQEFIRINKKLNSLIKFTTAFIAMTFCGYIPFIIVYLPTFSSERRLPVSIGFPFNWKDSDIAYWTAYLYIFFNFCITLFCMLLNVIIWYVMMNCAIKYETLSNYIRNLRTTKTTAAEVRHGKIVGVEMPILFLQQLTDLIKSHQQLRQTIDSFAKCFNNLFFTQISMNGLAICGLVFILVFTNNPILRVIYCAAAVYTTFDIFMVLYFGNEIRLSSDQLSYCLFESDWTGQSQSCQKTIIILAEFLKQPHQLIVWKLYPLNVDTFTSILNLTYRMFNILLNLK